MGMMIEGIWQVDHPRNEDGAFKRIDSVFLEEATSQELIDNPKRFDLYVSLACPWAHRTLIFRKIKGLESSIDVHYVDPLMGENGWSFLTPEPNEGKNYLYELYQFTRNYTGKVTVPVLWDKQLKNIRCNESSIIIKMLNSYWNHVANYPDIDLIPQNRQVEINTLNDWIYHRINNAVYRTGFATSQDVYAQECLDLFEALDELELKLQDSMYLLGDTLLEPDIRLFTTLIRFDWVYFGHFKCNIRPLSSYPRLYEYILQINHLVGDTVNREHIQQHYYKSHPWINPNGIVPIGPKTDY